MKNIILETKNSTLISSKAAKNQNDNKNTFTVFLDIDGVLNSWDKDNHLKERPTLISTDTDILSSKKMKLVDEFHLENIINFNTLIDNLSTIYDVEVVMITSWRQRLSTEEFIALFNSTGIKGNIVGSLKRHPMKPMGEGFDYSVYDRDFLVSDWINSNKIQEFIILDDEEFNYKDYGLNDNFYKTNVLKGLIKEDIHNIIKMITN